MLGWAAGWVEAAPPPTAYAMELTVVPSAKSPAVSMKIYRDGNRVMVEAIAESRPLPIGRQMNRPRSYFDLDTDMAYTTDAKFGPSIPADRPASNSPNCQSMALSGDWGDPFARSAAILADVNSRNPRQVGVAAINGFSTRIIETDSGGQRVRVWIDSEYDLIVKVETGGATTLEVKRLVVGTPPASPLAIPTYCAYAKP